MKERAERLLREMLGARARFRDGQWEAIRAVVQERERVLVVQQTGWGKSLVYFVATRLLRDGGAGPTILISPLLSLMRNQVAMARRIGVRAAMMNSANPRDWEAIEAGLEQDACDILLVSPERLRSERFALRTLPSIRRGIGLFVVDEAHCISDWGHDFRPDYRRIVRIVGNLAPTVPVLATTATANDRVVAEIIEQLGRVPAPRRRSTLRSWISPGREPPAAPALVVQRGPLARASLRIQVIALDDQAQRLAWLAEHLPGLPGTGIVYCQTVRDCVRVTAWLRAQGIAADAYHGRLPAPERELLEDRLIRNEIKALVATVALGMGFDKPDLRFVVHFGRPGSLVAYYQQIGRAGRAVDEAAVVLLHGDVDDQTTRFFIESAFPGAEAMADVLRAIETHGPMTDSALEPLVNLSLGCIRRCLTLLELAGAVAPDGKGYMRTVNPWTPDEERWQRVTARRYDELLQMQTFASFEGCAMEFIARALDDPSARPCGRCAACAGPIVDASVDAERVREASAFLQRGLRMTPSRAYWPDRRMFTRDGVALNPRNALGRTLCAYGDPGWGQAVKEGKYRDGRYGDELVSAAAALVRERWAPAPFPAWVVPVPSLRHPQLVPDFARRLADALQLDFGPALIKRDEVAEQKLMANNAHQLANVASAFAVRSIDVRQGPALLVDDIVDSGWTLTYCGALLRAAGCGVVYPFALASAATER